MTYTHKLSRIAIFLLIFTIGVMAAYAQDNSPQFQLIPDKTDALTGDTITVTVNVAGAVGVYGGSFKLSYDPQAFELILTDNKPVTPGAFFANEPGFALRNTVDPTSGTIEYAITLMQPAKPVNGDGVLGTFTLRALKDAPVALTAENASFVAPEFNEVDGHLVAQKVNQVAAQIQGAVGSPVVTTDSSINTESNSASASAAAAQPVVPNAAAVDMFSNPQLNAGSSEPAVNAGVIPVETVNRTDNAVSVAAVIFLVAGVILLTLSVGMYSRMRVHYTLAGNK